MSGAKSEASCQSANTVVCRQCAVTIAAAQSQVMAIFYYCSKKDSLLAYFDLQQVKKSHCNGK